MSNALTNYARNEKGARTNTPLTRRTPGRTDEVRNNAGSYVFQASDRSRLERFLILGVDGGTYYVGERKLTEQNVSFLKELIRKDERSFVDTVLDVRANNRAVKQSPAIFAIALVLSEGSDKAYAREAFNKMNFTSTHLFEFAEYIKNLGGWGRAKRSTVAEWYENMPAGKLAYQAVKYRQRNGWTHRDLFRLAHPKGVDQGVGNFILGKKVDGPVEQLEILDAFERVQKATSVADVKAVLAYQKNLPWETIPTQFLTDPEVWKTLFYNNQLEGQALVRNITRLARNGAFNDMVFVADYAERLADKERIANGRLHPINFLNAVVVHQEGQVNRDKKDVYWGTSYTTSNRNKDWVTSSKIVEALNAGFYESFKHVEPSGKPTLVAIDVSGSMAMFAANGLDLSAAQVAAAIGMTVARTEKYSEIVGFGTNIVDLGITSTTELSDAMRKVQRSFGSTNMSAALDYAIRNKIKVETFVTVTDNEANHGRKPTQALADYRQRMGIDARAAFLGVAATQYTAADPNDVRQIDFVGFDSNAPRALADFSAGRI